MTNQIIASLKKNTCESFITNKKNSPYISISCSGDFTFKKREKVLHIFFQNGYEFQKENIQIENDTGVYSYIFYSKITKWAQKRIYFKLHFRSAEYLWDIPGRRKKIAIFIQNLHKVKTFYKWEQLQIPLSYGLSFFTEEDEELIYNLKRTKQAIWMAPSLKPEKILQVMNIKKDTHLSMNEILQQGLLIAYIQKINKLLSKAIGFNNFEAKEFNKNIFAIRKVLNYLKKKKIKYILDTNKYKKSFFYKTSKIMSFNTLRTNRIIYTPRKKKYRRSRYKKRRKHYSRYYQEYKYIKSLFNSNDSIILLIDAENNFGYNLIRYIKNKNKSFYFSFIHQVR